MGRASQIWAALCRRGPLYIVARLRRDPKLAHLVPRHK